MQEKHHQALREGPTNVGYSGTAIMLLNATQSFERRAANGIGVSEEYIGEMATHVYEISSILAKFPKIIQGELGSITVPTNVEVRMSDAEDCISRIKSNISALCNNVLIIGEEALVYFENMYPYVNLIDDTMPDEFAMLVAKQLYFSFRNNQL